MSRIAIMVRLANGGVEHSGAEDGTALTHSTLSAARAELEEHLRDAAQAAAMGHLDDEHSVSDYYLHDTATGQSYEVAWGSGKSDLLVRVSHAAVLQALAAAVAAGKTGDDLAFELDAAQTAAQYGLEDHRRTHVVLLPSQDGPNWDKHVIAPSSMPGLDALKLVNDTCAQANMYQARIDLGVVEDDEITVAERIDACLEEQGFVILSQDAGNLRIAEYWEQDPIPEEVEEQSSAPGL